jgi:L-fuconolactonase
MRIDAHQHFWKYDPAGHAWINEKMHAIRRDFMPADLLRNMEQEGIAGTIAVQTDETEDENRFLLALAEQHPYIRGVVGWTDLKNPDLEERLEAWKRYPLLKGFRTIMQGQPDELYLGNDDYLRGVGMLHRTGHTYDLLVYHDQLPSLLRFTEKFPDQPFMLDHLGKPAIAAREIRKWKENIRILARHPHTFCKLSGMVTEADWEHWRYEDLSPYLEIAGEYFGTDRLCFGSDWPVCLVAGSYAEVSGILRRFLAQLPAADQEKIWGENASGFYSIES